MKTDVNILFRTLALTRNSVTENTPSQIIAGIYVFLEEAQKAFVKL